jgi:hypothetical protein
MYFFSPLGFIWAGLRANDCNLREWGDDKSEERLARTMGDLVSGTHSAANALLMHAGVFI